LTGKAGRTSGQAGRRGRRDTGGGRLRSGTEERKLRIEDAVSATKAAVAEGIIPGGGVTLAQAAKALASMVKEDNDEATGARIVMNALTHPLMWIAYNAGLKPDVIVHKVISAKLGMGF